MAISPALANPPDRSLISRLLNRWAVVDLQATAHVADADRAALGSLVDAAESIDRLYWQQRSPQGWALKEMLRTSASRESGELARLVNIGYGPWDVLDDDKPFWGMDALAPGGGLYPADLTREEFQQFIVNHPEQRASLMSPTTVVRRGRDGLVAVPYAEVYRESLEHVAAGLLDASRRATHAGFAAFLAARARDLVSGSLVDSEARWIDVGDSPIDIAVGPYEVYDDRLAGLKAAYEATVLVRHPLTDSLRRLEETASQLGRRLPGSVTAPERRQRVVIGVYDVVCTAGRANMGAKAIAAMLPNDERIRKDVGSRLLLFRNVIAGKFVSILKPIADRLLTPEQAALVNEDAFILHTVLHEMAHALMLSDVGAGANERLLERYSTIEECRADLVGLLFLSLLSNSRLFDPAMVPAAAITFVAGLIRSLRFGAENDYGRGAAMILTSLVEGGAIVSDRGGRLVIDPVRVYERVGELAQRVQRIAQTGDYAEAGALIESQASLPAIVRDRLTQFDDVPVDLEFRVDRSFGRR